MTTKILAAAFAAAFAAGVSGQSSSDIDRFLRIDDQVCTGGQPTIAQLASLKQEGVRAILNLREAEEHNVGEEQAAAAKLGLLYIHVPVRTLDPRSAQVDAFLSALENPKIYPIFIHCGSGNRVGAFWMIRRMVVDGWSSGDAEVEARRIGLTSPSLREFALAEARTRTRGPSIAGREKSEPAPQREKHKGQE
jgi:uncharacterized protein (TIGR01244 family)